MALRWVLVAATAGVASAAGFKGPEASAPISSKEFDRLKALVTQLAADHPAEKPQQQTDIVEQPLPALDPRPAPEPEYLPNAGGGFVSLKTTMGSSSGVPNPESNADEAVMVFDEAQNSVERALRRLQPSPGPAPGPGEKGYKNKFCIGCTTLHQGAVDEAGAKMCRKSDKGKMLDQQSKRKGECFAKYGDCPSDMSKYTCNGTAPSPPPPPQVPEGVCTTEKLNTIRTLKAEVRLCPMRQTAARICRTAPLATLPPVDPPCAYPSRRICCR